MDPTTAGHQGRDDAATEASPSTEAPVGVLLVNLGTPEGTDYRSIRRYLSEFLSDRRVVELSPWLWQPILQGIILTFRPRRSGHAYDKIWNRERNESPLRTITRAQGERLKERLAAEHPRLVVDWAMRYGKPSIAEKMSSLLDAGCRRILLFALYPQYSASTTATVHDAAFDHLKGLRWQPAIRTVPPWFDDPAYIDALARGLEEHLASLDWEAETVIASFHGLPQEYHDRGDPYRNQCERTVELLRTRLGWPAERLLLTFQSRFGPKAWLQPYTDRTLERLATEGVRRVAIMTPGFAADCLETLEEIDMQVRRLFLSSGGEHFTHVPCLNDSPASLDLLAKLVLRELAGWLVGDQ